MNTGSVSIADAVAKARDFAAGHGDRSGSAQGDPRLAGRSYRRSRSRSRSPQRRDNYRDNYNPYRDERRGTGAGGRDYGRSRSRSPQRGGRSTFSPQRNFGARDRPEAHDDNSEVILIDSALVGLVIGRQGENLRRIEQETQTRVQFIDKPDSGMPQRQCRISGTTRARMDAKREINRIIGENGGNPVREVGSQAMQQAQRGGNNSNANSNNNNNRGQKDGSNHPALREGENSIQILVPDRTVGLIIGRGGETIRDLQDRSGCHVNIVGENKSIQGMRPVNLIGSAHAAQMAKDLIMEIVESDTRQGGAGGAAGAAGTAMPKTNFDSYQQSSSAGSDKINENIRVPSDAVGMIIGKGGETIKDMQNHTGCKINVTQPSHPDIEREIGLIGTRQAIEAAKRAIWEKVDSVRSRDRGRSGGGGGGRDDYGGSGQGQYSQQQQPQYAPPPMPQAAAAPEAVPQSGAQGAAAGADPYAAYGGYQAYLAVWYQMLAQQQQQGGAQPPAQGPPGT